MTTQANIRSTRLQYLEPGSNPVSVRRIQGQVLTQAHDPGNVRSVRAQFLEPDANPASIRRVQGQALTLARDPGTIRAIRMQYLELEMIKPDFTADPWSSLLSLINRANGTTFTAVDLTPGAPEASTFAGTYNTQFKVTAEQSSGFSGFVYVTYHRWNLTDVINGNPPAFDLSTATRTADMLPQVNAQYGLNLSATDVEDLPVTAAGFDLVIAAPCRYFLPGTHFNFVY